jgi:UDP-N-acetyl-D-glucosamine dehydrogenase
VQKISIIGQGYVGLPLSMAFCEAGFNVIGLDNSNEKIEKLQAGFSYIDDIDDFVIQKYLKSGNYFPTTNPKDIAGTEFAIIAVPTPLDENRIPDLSYVTRAAENLGKFLDRDCLIINESTSFPGTLRNVIAPIVEKNSKMGITHTFAVSPERVDPGNSTWKIKNTPRLFSGLTKSASAATFKLYAEICESLYEVASPEIAESAKLFENTFRQVNIALVNEFSLIMQALGIPTRNVIDAANTKPYGFMKFNPSVGVGGHCIPVDPSYLAFSAREAGVKPQFIDLANIVNDQMPDQLLKIIGKESGIAWAGKKILICGLAYKPNIQDLRESPSLHLIKILESKGCEVSYYDPLIPKYLNKNNEIPEKVSYDLTIIAQLHDVHDKKAIMESAPLVFDITGKCLEAKQVI